MAQRKPVVELVPERVIDCSHEGCRFGSIARIWTATGWANVCKSHYETTEPAFRRSDSPTVVAIRNAYLKRTETISKSREPGSDDDPDEYALLMEELERRAQA